MAFSKEATPSVSQWRARALDRTLEPAATRSMARLERVLTATRELTDAPEDASFTVAEVAERAGVSLKSFYRSFAGKDDVILALLEEEIASARGGVHPVDPEPARNAEIVFAVLLDGLADVTLAGRDSKEVASSLWQFVAGGLRLGTKEHA